MNLKKFINSCIEEQFEQMQENLDSKLNKIAVRITKAVVQSLTSARDVDRRIISRIQSRKKKALHKLSQ